MRTKLIMTGAIAALALATLTANAGTTATHRAQGSLVSLVAAATTVAKAADRDALTVRTRSTASGKTTEASERPVAAVKPAAPRLLATTTGCQQAISRLKAMHQADLTEDAAERGEPQPISATALQADRAEDLAEAQHWPQALLAARTACLPQPIAACQAAISSLQTLIQANRTEELSELTEMRNQIGWMTELASLRTTAAAVAMPCADRG